MHSKIMRGVVAVHKQEELMRLPTGAAKKDFYSNINKVMQISI